MNARSRERRYWCERAWLGGDAPEPGVLLTVDARGRLASVAAADTPPADAERLTG